jgi:serine protease
LLPGYDFVGQDYSPTTGVALGTYLVSNDGDGWDPDPSDPGDWISSADQTSSLFPSADCATADSSWHGTRVVGILGAITNNDVGIAGMTWNSWILPVRALGKCGGYDSDIIAGIEWAAGISVSTAQTPVPDNPYPANIINLSFGGSGSCPTAYQNALSTVTGMGVLVVASAGNASGSVEAPANCSASVPGVIAVAGVRNVGTKVGYSSFGPEGAHRLRNCRTHARRQRQLDPGTADRATRVKRDRLPGHPSPPSPFRRRSPRAVRSCLMQAAAAHPAIAPSSRTRGRPAGAPASSRGQPARK